MKQNKLFLLDAMALIYRAYYALNKTPRVNSRGINTSAILGFAITLFDVIKNEQPTHIGVAFDTFAPTVRHDGFKAYKANREKTPEDIVIALPFIKRLIEGFNIPVLAVDGYEADDVIGTLTRNANPEMFTTYMMTFDKDFGQLVSDSVLLYKPARFGNKPEILGVKEVCEKFGIKRPDQVRDILGLWGDTSDNIPGIPGFGEVTARTLIASFDTVENLIANAESISNLKWREKVKQYGEQALLSKELATIIRDVPVAFNEEELKLKPPRVNALAELFNELEFKTFGKRYFAWVATQHPCEIPSQPIDTLSPSLFPESTTLFGEEHFTPFATLESTPHAYTLANSPETRHTLLNLLHQQTQFCFDTETTGLDPNAAELVGIAFSWEPHSGWYLPLPENYHETLEILAPFKPVFENHAIGKTGQNLKFDIAVLKWYDITIQGPLFDTMIAHYLLQPDMRHNMDSLAEAYLNYQPVPIESLIGKKGRDQLSMRSVPLQTVAEYAAEDADVTLQLQHVFFPMLKETGTLKMFNEIEIPLIPVLASMEATGVNIDVKALESFAKQLEQEIVIITGDIFSDAGTTFNIASPKQLGEVLFDHLRIVDKPRKTKTKQYSTGEEVLSKLIYRHPIIPKILEYRSLTKIKSTYVDVLPSLVNPRDGRVHTSYNQAVAATGRLSSNNPNLQNIPIRTDRGREIRKAFVPRNPDYLLLSADYSQIELRIIAHLSQDQEMIADFKANQDIHAATASRVFNVGLEAVTPDMRRKAKAVNFGLAYGMSPFGLAERLNISRAEAVSITEQYFSRYPGIKRYMNETIEQARRQGYVETIMHRRRYLRDINSGNANTRGFAERNAINAPIQGTAADMIKIAMIDVYHALKKRAMKSCMILQVHDELIFDTLKTEVEEVRETVRTIMEKAIPLDVPVMIDINTGENWLEAH